MKSMFLVLFILLPSLTYASDMVTWDALRPTPLAQSYEDLSAGDQALITEIHVYQLATQTRQLSPLERSGLDQRVALVKRLGFDVETLLRQRQSGEQQANEIIEDLHYEDMKMAGFLVPLEMTGLIGTQFILVPTAGACIHTPPPPVNQTVLVDVPQGYQLQSLYTPVWVEGSLAAYSGRTSVVLSDGNQAIQIGYRINATNIETYQ